MLPAFCDRVDGSGCLISSPTTRPMRPPWLRQQHRSGPAITGVLRQSAYRAELEEAGLTDVAVTATREVATSVFSAIIRASRP